ncbi:ankyrin repeat domain-containing protein 10a isoform X2 [Dunckerocampus dactyliophorus]|uniref:ankyrin repeat domain-containing protein 10a isoform X2 n=1 Tax=Dunckerocampus dactyliophorus TaxID=161453 RepID=UPI0024050D5C|nr:ankyrin repeat domain-containing protein 10a isoform X2 [Dunckerocampus dactyliophorus]
MSIEQEVDFLNDDEAFTSRFPIHRACRDGDVGALMSLFQNHTRLTTEDSCYGWTPIHWAAHCGQEEGRSRSPAGASSQSNSKNVELECVIRLVQMGCDVNTVSSRFSQTPTHTAAFGGHPHCVLWLSQAGADINRQGSLATSSNSTGGVQDLTGEAPIHKAARAGSLECIQVLLIAGAKPHVRNASGQTAADLARSHDSVDCLRLISNLLQLSEPRNEEETTVEGPLCGPGLLGRKRLQSSFENGHMKKAKRDALLQMHSAGVEDSMESNPQNSGTIIECFHPLLPLCPVDQNNEEAMNPACDEDSTPLSWQQVGAPPCQHRPADMCGSLHLTGSPSTCVSHRPLLQGLSGADYSDFLNYGHYHGFGDTAEELTNSGFIEQRSFQDAGGDSHLCQDS